MIEVVKEQIEWQAKVLPRVPSDETFFGVGHTPDEAVGAALDEARRWFTLEEYHALYSREGTIPS